MDSKVLIISCTTDPDRIVSSSARISTTEGDSISIYNAALDSGKNARLIERVLSSGHKSIIEHIVFNLAFVNVSACVEQFMLEFRLASFTVKSRRYVNFRNMGYVVPAFLDSQAQPLKNSDKLAELYHNHMTWLFEEYGELLDNGISKEDARFLLPYSYKSNFYVTVNARELLNILDAMLFGRGHGLFELRQLGEQLREQAAKLCPFIFEEGFSDKEPYADKSVLLRNITGLDESARRANSQVNYVELLGHTPMPELAVAKAALIECGNYSSSAMESVLSNSSMVERIVDMVIKNPRPRELEQINFTFRINGVSLPAITHLTRHRMQSIIIPQFCDVCQCDRFLIPDSISANPTVCQKYRDVFSRNKEVYDILSSNGLNKHEISYLYLSGNLIDVTTTMNARELYTFISLRSCLRTQWETRSIAIQMLNLIRNVSPVLFRDFGPNCYSKGGCPEGKKTCGKCPEIQRLFGESVVNLEKLTSPNE